MHQYGAGLTRSEIAWLLQAQPSFALDLVACSLPPFSTWSIKHAPSPARPADT